MERIEPKMSMTETGRIIWEHFLVDHNPELYFRGKKVTDIDFNSLFLKQAYQSNYLTDSLTKFFDEYLGPAIHNRFTSEFNLAPSYVKSFSTETWGELQEDGYYYITIPFEEHGLKPNEDVSGSDTIDKINVSAEMQVLTDSGQFTVVPQVEIDLNNTVRIYTDDPNTTGLVIIRLNDKAYTVAAAVVDVSQIQGLSKVAITAQYEDLLGIDGPEGPNTLIKNNADRIQSVISGGIAVHKASFSDNAGYSDYTRGILLDGTIQGIPVRNIFEEGSSKVKLATEADHSVKADHSLEADHSAVATYASTDTAKGTIDERLNKFCFAQQYYGGDTPQTIYGPATEKLWAFGNIVLDFPRTGVYEITTYVYCYSGNGGDSQYYITVDGVKTGPSAIIMGANTYIMHPLVVYATISAGTHTISLYGNQWKEGRTFNMSPYNQNQIIVKEV